MNLFKVTLSQLTVAGALNKSYRLQVSVVSENESILSCPVIKRCPEQNCFEVVPKRVQRRDSPDARWQRVLGTRRCHWKGSVADRGPAG